MGNKGRVIRVLITTLMTASILFIPILVGVPVSAQSRYTNYNINQNDNSQLSEEDMIQIEKTQIVLEEYKKDISKNTSPTEKEVLDEVFKIKDNQIRHEMHTKFNEARNLIEKKRRRYKWVLIIITPLVFILIFLTGYYI